MKIVVCVKYVPDAQGTRRFDPADHTTDRESVDGLLSELDEYAIEASLQIVEAGDGGEIVALTMGPDDATDALKKALQMGADAGVHISDETIAGSDASATSLVLAEAIRKLGADLVLTGMSSTDGSMGVMPAMIAERLGMPQATFASELTVTGNGVRIRRDGDNATEFIEASLPCVVSVTDQSNEPRFPSFKGIMAAKKKPVESWTIADLGLDASVVGLESAWTRVREATPRPPRQAGQVVSDDGNGGTALADFLTTAKFV